MEERNRTIRHGALGLLLAISLGGGLIAGCGSGDSDSETPSTGYASKPADSAEDESGEVTPESNKPASAGDKKNAPDRAISERPGGPGQTPVNP